MAEVGQNPRWLRRVVLAFAGIETVSVVVIEFFLLSQVLSSNEQLGRSIGLGLAGLVAVLFALTALPALILAIRGRWLKLALILAILGVLVPVVIRTIS